MSSIADIRAESSPSRAPWRTWGRWIAVLPVPFCIASTLASLASGLLSPLTGEWRGLVTTFCFAAIFVMAGAILVPKHKVATALVLSAVLVAAFAIWLAALRYGLGSWTTTWGYPWPAWATLIPAILGLVCGTYWVFKDAESRAT